MFNQISFPCPQEATQSGYMMTPGGQYRQNTMPQVYRNYIDGGAGGGAGGPQRRFKNLEDIVCFKVWIFRSTSELYREFHILKVDWLSSIVFT